MPEAIWSKLCGHGRLFQCGIEVGLCFGGRDAADGLEEASVIEPVDPFEGGELDGSPGPAPVDHLGLVESVDALGQGIVVAVPDTAD